MTEMPDLPHEFVVDDLDVLKVIAHNTRLDILQLLKRPKTVKQIAKKLKLPATKLYYHVNLMEKHGLIQVVETNIVSGILEKKYQVVANNYRVDNSLLTDQPAATEDFARVLAAIFDVTRSEIQRSVAQSEQNPFTETNEAAGIVWRASLQLTPEQYADFYGRFKSLIDDIAEANRQNSTESKTDLFGLTIAYYPIHPQGEEEA